MDQARIVFVIQFLNSFISGILGVALPLMMVEREISIVTIGFVFASMPMIFQIGRMFFAIVSDFWGRRPFFIVNGALNVITNLLYYFAYTPLEFLFGKVAEGLKDGSLWAVNRAFLLETEKTKWRSLVNLRTVAYLSFSIGSLLAGYLIVWFLFEGTLLICALVGIFVIPLSLLLSKPLSKKLNVAEAFHFLDFRKKDRVFNIFLGLFFTMGLSFGFISGFVFPLFLDNNGFNTETIGILIGVQILIASIVSYAFAGKFDLKKVVLLGGSLYTLILVLLGFSGATLGGILIIIYGAVEGLLGIGHEGIISKITKRESYGIDIGLLMMGLHLGRTISLALTGILISLYGFTTPFFTAAFLLIFYYIGSYLILRKQE